MKIDDLASKHDQAKIFNLEYEFRINRLKLDYITLADVRPAGSDLEQLAAEHQAGIAALRSFVALNFNHFNAASCSSLSCIPTRALGDDERYLHRIWMGGPLPAIAGDAIEQWGAALDDVRCNGGAPYVSILWAWDAQQLRNDERFSPTGGAGRYTIGRYAIGGTTLHINSLRALALDFAPARFDLLDTLHTQRYFATLSDYFRILIMCEYGGMYMDVDTIPHNPATIFLMKPEVPDYFQHGDGDGGGEARRHVSWMNLFLDETGMLIAKKNDAALRVIQRNVNLAYAGIDGEIPRSCPQFEARLFGQFYAEWKKNLGVTLLSHAEFYQRYCVLYDGVREAVAGGIRGMRLLDDIITDMHIPLSDEERRAYARCVARLDEIDWQLDDPLNLVNIVDVFDIEEVPRMAYAAQLRAEIDHFHYYSVLSDDPQLDRVNDVFCRYLLAHRSQHIAAGNFWRPTVGRHASRLPMASDVAAPDEEGQAGLLSHAPLRLVPGKLLGDEAKNRMAKLLFATSYLEYCSFGNKLNLQFVELQRRQNIDPYLAHIHGLHDEDERFIGFFTAATMAEFQACGAVSYYRDDMKALDDAYDAFVLAHARADDCFVSSLAIDEKYRGQGLFRQMFHEIRDLASRKGCARITLTVWEKSEALQVYLHKGFRSVGTFDYAYSLFYDRLHFLVYEGN
ncbi:GNAT family N-acetyltransferase [Janthinobacterium violaceinigrum]|uniref:GNAT family N-acetyltransferase n=1 Tax=Janthinobacterium violaceinigrum TaxID=2654252 RepID=A0A6I1HN13_9BURK|nr:GNAT family N-acetyltransferase [Janthinobacterium violaceinigrum]KAB8059482.1 GNAT family N-acetyltransferase [Janthinobacterium violaceinigrum]